MSVTLPPGPDGQWRGVMCVPPPAGGRLAEVTVRVAPPTAFRVFRAVRESDGEVLANGGWTPSRDRPLRLFPASDWVGPADRVRFEVRTWDATACEGVLTWTR